MHPAEWSQLVDAWFGFLRSEFGCGIVERSDVSGWVTKVVYQNATTAVEVNYDLEFEEVGVQLLRLKDGRRPPYPVFISEHAELHTFSLAHLLKRRAPDRLRELQEHRGLQPEQVETQLQHSAAALKEFGSDVLRGDFAAFAEMESDLRAIVRDQPERTEIWVPFEGDPRAEIERLRGHFPAIPVHVRRYASPSRLSLVERVARWLSRRFGR